MERKDKTGSDPIGNNSVYKHCINHITRVFGFQRNKIRVEEKPKIKEIRPCSNYKDKYAHIIGRAAALEAAVKTEVNKSYGFGMFHKINQFVCRL